LRSDDDRFQAASCPPRSSWVETPNSASRSSRGMP
jgi:hypothetical protein